MSTNKLYDALIIGGGPAGLAAALAFGRVHRSCLVFSSDKFRNDGIHASHTVLGWDHTPPEKIRDVGRQQIERYGNTEFVETYISKISRTKLVPYEGFTAEDDSGRKWGGRSVVLAMGTKDVLPDIPGYKENWPSNIYQCFFCDGHERSHLPMGALASVLTPMEVGSVSMMHSLSFPPGVSRIASGDSPPKSNVTVFTNGPLPESPDEARSAALAKFKVFGITVDQRKIVRLEPDPTEGLHVVLSNPDGSTSSIYLGFLGHKPSTEPVGQHLIDQLGVETTKMMSAKFIKREEPFMKTNIKGVVVAGDAGTYMTQVTGAMFTGAAAAAGLAKIFIEEDGEIMMEKFG